MNMPSSEAIQKCRELQIDEKWAEALDDMWAELDADIIRMLERQQGASYPGEPGPPYDGSQKRRRYWKKVKFSDE